MSKVKSIAVGVTSILDRGQFFQFIVNVCLPSRVQIQLGAAWHLSATYFRYKCARIDVEMASHRRARRRKTDILWRSSSTSRSIDSGRQLAPFGIQDDVLGPWTCSSASERACPPPPPPPPPPLIDHRVDPSYHRTARSSALLVSLRWTTDGDASRHAVE